MPRRIEDIRSTHDLSDSMVVSLRRGSDERGAGGVASLVLFDRSGARVVPLVEGRVLVIGRIPPADVVVDHDSISREHARVVLREGRVWVEDLGSTNGTRLEGKRIDQVEVSPGQALALGAVPAAVQLLGSMEDRQFGLFGHESFLLDLEAEVVRAHAFHRPVALVMLRDASPPSEALGAWFADLQEHLRPFDRLAYYGSGLVEVLLPEVGQTRARDLVTRVRASRSTIVAGIAVFPDHASSAGELLEVTLRSVQRASVRRPVLGGRTDHDGQRVSLDDDSDGPVVHNLKMKEVFGMAARVSGSSVPVLITGETGTGKELVARAIHDASPRARNPMITINCAAIPDNLVESTLFGHERGAFTGAARRQSGVFEAADGGTVFLDEVGELPAAAQAALLRVLETRRFCRVGSTREMEVDVRLLTATHRDLEAMCGSGAFREDLLYRINTIRIDVPPLRDRLDDIEPLAHRFVRRAAAEYELSVHDIDPRALDRLWHHPWPGNVRELRNVIERAVVITSSHSIRVEDLPAILQRPEGNLGDTSTTAINIVADPSLAPALVQLPVGDIDLRDELKRYEVDLIEAALRRHEYNRAPTAKSLGVPLRTLAYKIRTLEIEEP